jgi:type I restriction enzyme S subunit
LPIVNVKDMRPGYVDVESCTKITTDDFQSLARNGCDVQRHDVLLSKDGTIGKVVVYRQPEALVALSSIAILRPKQSVDSAFLGHALQSYDLIRQYAVLAGGSALRRLVLRDINRVRVLVPPHPEQSRISAVLDTVDESITKTEAVIAKLRQVRSGLLQDLLTRGLDHHGQLRDPIAHPEQFQNSLLGRIPKEWEIKELGSLAQFITSGSRGWASFYSEEGKMFLRIGNLTREHINLRLADIVRVRPPAGSEGSRTKVEPGDVLISVTADLGIIGVIPEAFEEAYVNQHIALVRPVETVCSRWIGRYLSFGPAANHFRMLNDTGAKAGMNLPSIASLRVAIPNREEQDRVKSVLDSMDATIAQQLLHQIKLQEIKSGLMNDLLTGRVRVPETIGTAS